jgi:hypothetical protein
MHSPHFMQAARNFFSGNAPGGRISFEQGFSVEADRRNSGTTDMPSRVEKIHFRRGKSMGLASAGAARIGKVMALVGHFEAQE